MSHKYVFGVKMYLWLVFCFIGSAEGTSYETKGTVCRRCALARR